MTTEIHRLADALGRPIRLLVTAGQVGDITQAPALLEGQSGTAVLADKACDSKALRTIIADMGAAAVIPSNRSRTIIIPHDTTAYNTATASNAASTSANTSGASHTQRAANHPFRGFVPLAAINLDEPHLDPS